MPDIFDTISPSPTPQVSDFSKYNTKLTPQEEVQFQGWKQKNAPNDSGEDYDLRGAFKADQSGKLSRDSRGHTTDLFKKPNHPTFSDQSQYSGKDGFVGGKWGDDNSFTPSPTNLQMNNPQQLQQYFKTVEPNSKLNFPKQDIFDQIAPDKPPGQPNLRSMVHQDLGTELESVRDFLPAAGGMAAGIPGAAAGAFAKQALSPNPDLGQAVGDTALQGVIPEGISSVLSRGVKGGISAVLSKLPQSIIDRIPGVQKAGLSDQIAAKMGSEADLVQSAARSARANRSSLATPIQVPAGNGILDASGNPAMKTIMQDHPVYSTPIGKKLTGVESSAPAFSKVAPAADELLSDVQSVRNAKLMSGPGPISAIAANDIVTKNFKASTNSINAPNILNELSGPKADVYKEALGKDGYGTFLSLIKSASDKGVGQQSPGLFSWYEGRKLAITGAALSAIGVPFKATEGVILGADAIKKIAQNPDLGRLIIQATKTGSKAPEASLLMKSAMNGLRGTTVYLQNGDGQKDAATIQADPKSGEPQLQYSQKPSGR